MYRLKYLFLVVIFVAFSSVINSITFEEYPIGCYSMMKCGSYNNPYFADRDSILAMIDRMGYNLVQIENVDGDDNLSDMLNKLYNNQLSAIVEDKYYPWPDYNIPNVNDNLYSTSPLTTSSYLKFEAEYSGENDVDEGTIDANWYCSKDEHDGTMPRVGEYGGVFGAYYWKCIRGTINPGFAYTDIRWRWPHTDYPDDPYQRLGEEFKIYNVHDTLNYDNKYLYIRFRLKLANFTGTIDATTPLLSFSTMGYRRAGSSDSTNVDHEFVNYNSNLLYNHTTDYFYGDFVQAGSPSGYYDIEIKISYADMRASGLLRSDWWRYALVNLNPRVYWYGNCDLYLDYIELEDQMHYNLTHDAATYASSINNRIEYLQDRYPAEDIIKYLYSVDEPGLGQFDSYRTVQQYINQTNPNIITAAYDTDYNKIQKADSSVPGYYRPYDHVKSFRDSANPNVILPDMYPVREVVDFNSADSGNPNALQTLIDDKVLRQYRNAKEYSIETTPHKTFIPIVQTFGAWNGSAWTSWILPPFETQKCLKYLPLCYGADGILDYRAVSDSLNHSLSSNPSGQYASILIDCSGFIDESNITREAVTQANAKISVIGPIIKDSLNWLDAGRLNVGSEPSDLESGTSLSYMGLSSLQVYTKEPEPPENPRDGYYQGYIQCGFMKIGLILR